MSLDYDMRNVSGFSPEWWEVKQFGAYYDNSTLFETFVFRMMALRAGETITDSNIERFILRNRVYESAIGGIHIPDAFIRGLIGLRTNIFPAANDAQFGRVILNALYDKAHADMRNESEDGNV